MMSLPTRWITILAFIAVGLLLSSMIVSAHAGYERSEPARDAVLLEPPSQVDVWFTQEVFKQQGANFVRVFDENEVQVSEGDGLVDDDDRKHISTTLPPGLPEGRYIVRWMTTSDEDGDTDEGAFCFYVVVTPTAEQQAECAALAEEEATPTAAATATPGATLTAAPSDGAADSGGGGGAPVGAIVGGVVGAAALVVAIAGAALWMRRARP